MLTESYIFSLLNNYFSKNGVVDIQKDSFEELIHNRLQKIMNEEPIIEIQVKKGLRYVVEIKEIIVDKPYIIEEDRTIKYITPNEARLRNLTYDSPSMFEFSYKINRKY